MSARKHKVSHHGPGPRWAADLAEAESHAAMRRYEACMISARRVLESDSNHVGALELMAKSCWQTGDLDLLLQTLNRLTVLNPYEPGYHSLKAAALQAKGRYGEAVRSLARAMGEPHLGSAGDQRSLLELQAWQEMLISDLLAEDRTFRIDYSRDPKMACEARGFALVSAARFEQPQSEQIELAAIYPRPS